MGTCGPAIHSNFGRKRTRLSNFLSLQSAPAKLFWAGCQKSARPVPCLPAMGTSPLALPSVGFRPAEERLSPELLPHSSVPRLRGMGAPLPRPRSGPDYKGLPPGF